MLVRALALVLLLATSAQAQVIFSANLGAGAVPTAGFDATSGDAEVGVSISRTHLPTGGPTGGGAYRFAWIYDPAQQDAPNGWGGQFYYGWGVDMGTAPSSGVARYVRFKLRVVAGSNCHGLDWTDGSAAMVSSKISILGDGASGRAILELRCFPDTAAYELRPARDGAGYGTNTATVGNWVSVQMEAVSGASGSLRLWIDNDTYATPNEEQTGLSMGAATWDLFNAGYYTVNSIASDGTFSLDIGAMEVGESFDASWAAGGATVPDPPTIGTATPGNGSCSVTFTPPVDDGGATITGYTATSSPGSFTGTGAGSPVTVTGLSNGTGYTFTVVATNAEGDSSPSSASNSCTPAPPGTGGVRLRLRGDH